MSEFEKIYSSILVHHNAHVGCGELTFEACEAIIDHIRTQDFELARRDEYILKLEAKIPKLNIDLAEASKHAYNGESARIKLEAELASLNAELLELNDKAVFIKFENEDELPAEIKDDVYSAMFECSHVDGVRLFPYIEENGQKFFLVMLNEEE